MSYNGWTNYETWNVKLWQDNEEPSYRYWKATAAEVWEETSAEKPFTHSENARRVLANRLQNEVTDGNPLADAASMYSDLMGAALSEINWAEIANAWLEECEGYEYADMKPVDA